MWKFSHRLAGSAQCSADRCYDGLAIMSVWQILPKKIFYDSLLRVSELVVSRKSDIRTPWKPVWRTAAPILTTGRTMLLFALPGEVRPPLEEHICSIKETKKPQSCMRKVTIVTNCDDLSPLLSPRCYRCFRARIGMLSHLRKHSETNRWHYGPLWQQRMNDQSMVYSTKTIRIVK